LYSELVSATGIAVRADKEKRFLEIKCRFPHLVEKEMLYEAEQKMAEIYHMNSVRILPSYPSECFDEEYISQVLLETERIGLVAKGFFSRYEAKCEGKKITITIPFGEGGVHLLYDAKTPHVIERILMSEFGLAFQVSIEQDANASLYMQDLQARDMERLDAEVRAASEAYTNRPRGGSESTYAASAVSATPAEPALPRVSSLLKEGAKPLFENGIFSSGYLKLDFNEPQFSIGSPFELTPIALSELNHSMKAIIAGEVFGFSQEANRTGDKMNTVYYVTDGYTSVEVHNSFMELEDAKHLASVVSNGKCVVLKGYAKHETRRGKTDEDLVFFPSDVALVSKIKRKDNAPKKRVELHLHTNMSAMDALIPPDVAVKTAKEWGHPAIAITDHGNLQGFPDAMLTSEKIGDIKVIYGLEAYFVNDTASAASGHITTGFDDEIIIFDIETTGLSVLNCGITEIGAVKIKKGKVIDRFNTFVNPEMPIPEEIVKLTSITEDMVKDAPFVKDALKSFFDFTGNALLVAHNANFDIGFIRHFADKSELSFHNPHLDTLALSRFLNPDLKNHKLDTLAKLYELGNFNHHRACDDAEMLAHIFFCMMKRMKEMDMNSFADMHNEMIAKSDPLKLPTYHQILLVKNKEGLKNLYKLVSYGYLKYYKRTPRIPKSELEKHRDGLIVGSACEAGE
ncbi:MAG: PHP domain-containing protein, partial [Clostridia bacterium]|nr:PHP domain-containing protein [Clostridia bacterium]